MGEHRARSWPADVAYSRRGSIAIGRASAWSLALTVMFAMVVLWPRDARACKPFIQGPTQLHPPVALDPEVVTTSAAVQLACRAEGRKGADPGELRCQLRIVQQLENRSDHPVQTVVVAAMAPSLRPEGPSLGLASADGRAQWSRSATEDELARWRERAGGSEHAAAHAEFLEVVAIDLRLEPAETIALRLNGTASFERSINGCSTPAIYTRHRLVSPDDTQAIVSILPPSGGEAVAYDIGVELPTGWVLDRPGSSSPRVVRRVRGPGVGRGRSQRSLKTDQPFDVTIRRRLRFVRGGPLVGIGLDLGDGVRPRLRAGWEVASPWPLWMHGLAVESDLRSMTLVPSTQVASPNIWMVFPSLGVGVGAPVQLLPRPRAGVRTLLSMHWPFVGVVGTLDIFPVAHARPDLRGGVMLQVGL